MKLETEFYRLPIRFDAARLLEEVRQFEDQAWRPDRFTQFDVKGYASLNLVSHRGLDTDFQDGPMETSPHLARCPYIQQVLASFNTVFAEVRLRWLRGQSALPEHYDITYFWFNRLRMHISVVTDPAVEFKCNGKTVHMAAGEVWVFDRLKMHTTINNANVDRVHLIMDTAGSAAFWELLEHSYRPFDLERSVELEPRFIPYEAGKQATVLTEKERGAPVMPPAELDYWLADVVERFKASRIHDPARARRLLSELDRFRRDWRTQYALHGARKEGWPVFRALALDIGHEAAKLEGSDADRVSDMNPPLSWRLADFLTSGAFNPLLGRTDLRPDPEADRPLELGDNPTLVLSADGEQLELQAPKRRLTAEEVLFLSFVPGRSPRAAAEAAGLELTASLKSLVAELGEGQLLQNASLERPIEFDFDDARDASFRDPAKAKKAPAAPPPAVPAIGDRLIAQAPLYFRILTNGKLGLFVPRDREYKAIPASAVDLLQRIVRGASPRSAAEAVGIDYDAELESFLGRLVALEVLGAR